MLDPRRKHGQNGQLAHDKWGQLLFFYLRGFNIFSGSALKRTQLHRECLNMQKD